ncbi:MAG: flagellar motor switch protein FliN [Jatrophihabitans sp.]|uniref:flagellar motor switch protein FliN n=1 Tax=Jatrophihabitans sp. TaxID=1932789 RepID=UPI003F8108B2
MTTAPTVAVALASQAAAAVAATLASAEPLTAGEPTPDTGIVAAGGQAVLVPFTGRESGEVAIVLDEQLGSALAGSELGPLDPGQALGPTLDAVALALGDVVLGRPQTVTGADALARVMAHDDAVVVPLLAADVPQAAVLVGIDAPAVVEEGPGPSDTERIQRLELLRGVEMEVYAELGRTRMTVNNLLALRPGAIIELDRAAGAPADLLVNGHLIARGEVVVIDENYALRITQILSEDGGR